MEIEKQEPKVVDVLPITKGRRILVFLGDYFLNFMLSFLLFTIMVLPLGKVITSYDNKNSAYSSNLLKRVDILYDTQILFNSNKVDRSEIVYNTSFTYYVYLSYFTYDVASPSHVEFDQYGHKEENNIFRHYYLDILNDESKYQNVIDTYNKKHNYFVRTNNDLVLKDEIKSEILSFYDTSDKPTKTCETYMSNIEHSFFYPVFSEVMTEIKKKDLVSSTGLSFNKVSSELKTFENYINNMALATGLISLVLSTSILFILIPLINKTHKSVAMMVMKVERIDINSLNIASKSQTVIHAIYQLFTGLLISFFVPIGLLTIQEIFNITILFVLALFAIALMLSSLIVLLFNKFNRTTFDTLTRTVYVSTETLDKIYRSKGYYI